MSDEVAKDISPIQIKITSGEFTKYTQHQVGVILTILEASIPEGKQLEATKSLVKSSLYRDATELESWCYGNVDGKKTFPWSDR